MITARSSQFKITAITQSCVVLHSYLVIANNMYKYPIEAFRQEEVQKRNKMKQVNV